MGDFRRSLGVFDRHLEGSDAEYSENNNRSVDSSKYGDYDFQFIGLCRSNPSQGAPIHQRHLVRTSDTSSQFPNSARYKYIKDSNDLIRERSKAREWARQCCRANPSLKTNELEDIHTDSTALVPLYHSVKDHYWKYLDNDSSRPNVRDSTEVFKSFLSEMFYVMFPEHMNVSPNFIYSDFLSFWRTIPVAGVAILNQKMNKIFLVKGRGSDGGCWGFPKGKQAFQESLDRTAIREVMEETGIDLSGRLTKHTPYIEQKIPRRDRSFRLYLLIGVDESEGKAFQPSFEISRAEWVPITKNSYMHSSIFSKNIYQPFFKMVCLWIDQKS